MENVPPDLEEVGFHLCRGCYLDFFGPVASDLRGDSFSKQKNPGILEVMGLHDGIHGYGLLGRENISHNLELLLILNNIHP